MSNPYSSDAFSRLNSILQRLGHAPAQFHLSSTTIYHAAVHLDPRTQALLADTSVYLKSKLRQGRKAASKHVAKHSLAKDLADSLELVVAAAAGGGQQHEKKKTALPPPPLPRAAAHTPVRAAPAKKTKKTKKKAKAQNAKRTDHHESNIQTNDGGGTGQAQEQHHLAPPSVPAMMMVPPVTSLKRKGAEAPHTQGGNSAGAGAVYTRSVGNLVADGQGRGGSADPDDVAAARAAKRMRLASGLV